jgi:polyphosphate:AMP phosphotransferase
MLDEVDLTVTARKAEFKAAIPDLEIRLASLQRRAIERGVPVVIVIEGWGGSGKGDLINRLILALDPRHFSVHSTNAPNDEERLRPFLWRFWTRTPPTGKMSIFDRSWYTRVLRERVERIVAKKRWKRAFKQINSFERKLTDDGALIVKVFLHISKKTQRRRFKVLERNPSTSWRVTKEDWKRHRRYGKLRDAADDMLKRTDTENAPWTVIEAENRRHAVLKLFRTVVGSLERRLDSGETVGAEPEGTFVETADNPLDDVDLSPVLTRDEYNDVLEDRQKRIRELEHEAYIERLPVVIVYEGWDAAGKGGNIRRLTQNMDPRGYDVAPFGAPNDIERRHHYLWRFWNEIPKAGHIEIFDRSWYGRVLVERVEGYCTETEWQRAYREINEFETQITNHGSVLVKFWLHIDPDEQLRRFEARKATPHKRWKITDEDWRNRDKWNLYYQAVGDMIRHTSTKRAPWTIVEANSKLYARIKALDTVIAAIESAL